jgi:hypothetical protein
VTPPLVKRVVEGLQGFLLEIDEVAGHGHKTRSPSLAPQPSQLPSPTSLWRGDSAGRIISSFVRLLGVEGAMHELAAFVLLRAAGPAPASRVAPDAK